MVGSFYKRGDFAWVQDVRANYLCIHKGELVATVLGTAWLPWQVILHEGERAGLLQSERFDALSDAMSRAEAIVGGKSEQAFIVSLPPLWNPAG